MDKWYEVPGKAGTNVIYSRVRLVRNLKEYPFPGRLTKEQSAELSEKLLGGLTGIASMDRMQYRFTHLERMGDLEKTALLERRAINRSVMKKKDPTGMILSEDESTAILLNGDDHVRIQTLQTGLTLEQLYERADKIDDYISERFDYAFDEKYGYLTSFPTNVGTGLRAAVVLHLPMLSKNKNFNSLVADMGRFGTQVRGVEIIDIVRKAALELDAQERRVRREYRQRKPVQAADECYKSYGVLKYARRLTRKDGMEFLSQIMTGITDGILKVKEPYSVYGLMLGIQPANLLSLADRPLDKDELDAARAEFLRRRLPEIIEIEN